TPLVLAWTCNEAGSGSLALRPARWLALLQQGRLLPSFRRPGRPGPTSVMTTRANSQFPRPDFHRQDEQPYGPRADETDLERCKLKVFWPLFADTSHQFGAKPRVLLAG